MCLIFGGTTRSCAYIAFQRRTLLQQVRSYIPACYLPSLVPITTYSTRFAYAFSDVVNKFTVPKSHFRHQDARYRGAMQSATRPLSCSQPSPEVIR
jgi:hypothetical protein